MYSGRSDNHHPVTAHNGELKYGLIIFIKLQRWCGHTIKLAKHCWLWRGILIWPPEYSSDLDILMATAVLVFCFTPAQGVHCWPFFLLIYCLVTASLPNLQAVGGQDRLWIPPCSGDTWLLPRPTRSAAEAVMSQAPGMCRAVNTESGVRDERHGHGGQNFATLYCIANIKYLPNDKYEKHIPS